MIKAFIIFIIFNNVVFCQNLFSGKILIKTDEKYTERGYEGFLFINQKFKNLSSIEEYNTFLDRNESYIICNDTLIHFLINSIGDTVSTNIQINKNLFIRSKKNKNFINVKIKSSLNEVKEFLPSKNYQEILGIKTRQFVGITPKKSTEFKLYINTELKYMFQNSLGYLFEDIFNSNGMILKSEQSYRPWNHNSTSLVKSITPLERSCKSKLEELSFFKLKDDEDIITLDKLLVKNGKDTTIIEEVDRKLLPILARGLDGTEVNLENLKGHYTIVDLWATWCQPCIYAMPALGDIYDKYRYHGLKVVSISLDGEPASEKWKKMIDKENIYWDNYIMPEGFDSELCKQLNVKAIPHFILLDPEGRIMLENAPGPSDPNLTAVLDRLLMGKK